MTEPVKPLPAEGTAVPKDQPSGQPTTPQGQDQETPKEEPKYVTMESLMQFGDTLVKRINMASKDRSQKIETEVKAIAARLEKAGATVTPEITQNLRQQV